MVIQCAQVLVARVHMHILTSFVQNDNNSLPSKDRCVCTHKFDNKHCVRFTPYIAITNGYVHTGTAITVHLENDWLMQRLVVFVCCKIEIVCTCHECELTHKLPSKTDLLLCFHYTRGSAASIQCHISNSTNQDTPSMFRDRIYLLLKTNSNYVWRRKR